ncbi:DNA (cytosine-5)-methyltransferase 1 [Paenarthrobacter nicotinovorans]|uniref:DNA cytosine methyltransferase n=1 Tax=Paenarthrobacter nicotinovorans TaxID=29320 RepID=UPI002782D287|nr:DNA cytosine methyltransferase [Paenarthrobacter nicotinovorans]MDP9934753.1 DNA (cytosine-5)-methyltransferase 1 [Paenarthrobacter nicotinovorans]
MTFVQSKLPHSSAQMVDLFAGPGGLDVAARWMGLSVVGIEWDENACATRRAAGLGTVQGDVREHGPAEFPHATILTGGPPCQTFTVAGAGAGRKALDQVLSFIGRMAKGEDLTSELASLDDERTGLVLQPLRWALEAYNAGNAYQVIVLEQVPAVLPVWEAMASVLDTLGYKTVTGVLHAEEYGIPQTRRRAILIANRYLTPALPTPTHLRFKKNALQVSVNPSGLRECKSIGETLDRTEPYVLVSNYGTGGDPKARGRRASTEPAFTVTGKVSRNRLFSDAGELDRLDLSEAGRLQTFPHDYPWSGKDVSQQIGNAIPPRLAAHVLAAALGQDLAPDFLDTMTSTTWLEASSAPNVPSEIVETLRVERCRPALGTPDFDPGKSSNASLQDRPEESMTAARFVMSVPV